MRFFADQKFKRKRRKADKNKPKPVFNPPNRTEEETKAIEMQMQALYKEYLGEPGGHKAHELLHTSYVARKVNF